jgi:hypothetical protein
MFVRVVVQFAFNGVPRSTGAGAVRAAALDDEVRNDPVEGEAVIIPFLISFSKLATVLGASTSNSSITMVPFRVSICAFFMGSLQ